MRHFSSRQLAFCVLALVIALPAAAKDKIGVVEFEERSSIGLENASKVIPEMLSENIVNVGVHEVAERLLLAKVLEEQEFALSGIVDVRSAPEIGQIYGLDALVVGSYMRVGRQITINARLIDSSTGQVEAASTVKFDDLYLLESQLEIVAYELSGIGRERMKVIKEDIEKSRFKVGACLGVAYGSDLTQNGAIAVPIGFFVTSRLFTFDFLGGAPVGAEQITFIFAGPGMNIGRYFNLGVGYSMMDVSAGPIPKDQYLATGENQVRGTFTGAYLNLRVRPSARFNINLLLGANLGTDITRREGSGSGDTYYTFEDDRLFYAFPTSPFGLSADYSFGGNWGVRAFFLMAQAEGDQVGGPTLAYTLQDHGGLCAGLMASYSLAFGNK